jgi:PAS domain S-box-containing protein
VSWNPGAERIKGYTADEIVGQHFSTFYLPDDIAAGKPQRELAEAAEHGQCRDEGWRVRKDGTRFWANVVITAVLSDDGRLQGFAKITRDDTDRKSADEQVRELELATERERIAGELHQSLVHRIFEAGLDIQSTLQLIDDPAAASRIRAAVKLLDETLQEIRRVVLDLDNARGSRPR